jgi:hypothetical protein
VRVSSIQVGGGGGVFASFERGETLTKVGNQERDEGIGCVVVVPGSIGD